MAIVYYTPAVVEWVVRTANQRQSIPQKASAMGPAVLSPSPSPFHGLIGVYWCRSTLPTRGNCSLKFELRDNREKAGFSGYSTLLCTPLFIMRGHWGEPVVISPTSVIMSGVPKTGAIHFSVDDAVSVADGCAPTAFTVKPFGVNQVAVEWVDTCHGGQIILQRSSR